MPTEDRSCSFIYRPVRATELDTVLALESLGFPPDEAASLETIRYRHSVAPELFIGAYDGETLVGFINATRSLTGSLDHSSMTRHEDSGRHVLIHSVCVHPDYRRRGVATGLLRSYIDSCRATTVASVVLACHEELQPLYLGAGFVLRGPSTLLHGSRDWWEMAVELGGPQTNPSRLLCPVERCRCVILRKDVGRLVTRPSCPLPARPTAALDMPTHCWLVPSPTSFENIGFSKPVNHPADGGPVETRWLSCGACDHGPLGWTESSANLAQQFAANPNGRFGNVLFLLDCDRVHVE